MLKKYKLGFDISGLVIFLIIMLPNFIWFAVPAPNDILRQESMTPIVDIIGSVCQIIFIASLCIVINKERDSIRISPLLISSAFCIGLYFLGWGMYYNGIVNPMVIICLTLPLLESGGIDHSESHRISQSQTDKISQCNCSTPF